MGTTVWLDHLFVVQVREWGDWVKVDLYRITEDVDGYNPEQSNLKEAERRKRDYDYKLHPWQYGQRWHTSGKQRWAKKRDAGRRKHRTGKRRALAAYVKQFDYVMSAYAWAAVDYYGAKAQITDDYGEVYDYTEFDDPYYSAEWGYWHTFEDGWDWLRSMEQGPRNQYGEEECEWEEEGYWEPAFYDEDYWDGWLTEEDYHPDDSSGGYHC